MSNPYEFVPENMFSSTSYNAYEEDNVRWQSTLAFQQNQLTYMRDELSNQLLKHLIVANIGSELLQQLNLKLAVVIALQVKLKSQEGLIIETPETPQQDVLNIEVRIKQEHLRDEILYFEQQYIQLKQQYRQLVNKI
jgi:hypothetical protein